jgi:hypothetical protein
MFLILKDDMIIYIDRFTSLSEVSSTCKHMLYYKKIIKYRLDTEYSKKYYFDSAFRTLVNNRIKYPQKQLDIDLSYSDKIYNVDNMYNVNKLNLSNCANVTDVSNLGNIDTLDLSYCSNITGIEKLNNVRILNLTNCYIEEQSEVSEIKRFDFNDYIINKNNIFENFDSEFLKYVRIITNTDNLGKSHTLNLSTCFLISDIKSLSNVYDLNLSWCQNIIDLNILKAVKILNLTYCPNIIYDNLIMYNIEILNLSHCSSVIDVRPFSNIKILNLSHCRNIIDFSPLYKVKKLNLNFTNITNANNLGNVYDLSLMWCDKLCDISDLGNNHTLNISLCDRITNIDNLKNVYELDISWCQKITDIRKLHNVHITKQGCRNIIYSC